MHPLDPNAIPLADVIGLMLMTGLRGASLDDPALAEDLAACAEGRVGGVILFDVHLPRHGELVTGGLDRDRALQTATRNIIDPVQTPALAGVLRRRLGANLIVSVDQEGGGVARLNPRRGFPRSPTALEFGAMAPGERAGQAAALARGVCAAGCDLNFAPCVDALINPDNPIIAGKGRSFGSDAVQVAGCAAEVIRAHAEQGVVTCLKHFPGHGSSAGDTHAGFVDVTRTWRESPELEVYRRLIPKIDPCRTCVMTAHVFHGGIDPEHPASLSRAHTTGLLREKLGFEGVVITDSLDMGAVTQRYGVEEAAVLAVNAGADILLDGFNAPREPAAHPAPLMHRAIAAALRDGRIEGGEARVRASAARIARLQRWSRGSMMAG